LDEQSQAGGIGREFGVIRGEPGVKDGEEQ
jgi:hypothetical protein